MTQVTPRQRPYGHRAGGWVRLALGLAIALGTAAAPVAQVQWDYESLTRGKLWQSLWNSLQYGEPGALFSSPAYTLDYPGHLRGARAEEALNYAEAAGFAVYGSRNGQAAAYTLNTRFQPSSRYVYPTEPSRLIENYNLVDPSVAGEEIVTGAHHVIDLKLDVSHRSMAWSYPDYDDFVIHEITLTNNDVSALSDVHFAMRYGLRFTLRSGTDYDEKYDWNEDEELFYFYDHWSTRREDGSLVTWNFGVGPERGDIGDASDIDEAGSLDHELDAPAYFTALPLDCRNGTVTTNILEHLGGDFQTDAPQEDVMFRQDQLEGTGPARFREVMTHQQPKQSWDELADSGGEGGNRFERRPEYLVSCGPFEIAPFESITLVFAEVMAEIDRSRIVEGGVENIDHMLEATPGLLMDNVRAAKRLYARDYQPEAHPPPTPTDGPNSLSILAGAGEIVIGWPPIDPAYTDPLTGADDLAGYRVYRSSTFTIGPWTEIADIPVGETTVDGGMVRYVDDDVPFGVGNYYTVTSYDTDGNESGRVNANRDPVYPERAPNAAFPAEVYVVPNPFRQHSQLLGEGERYRMEFVGLPAQATIQIYTLTGETLKTIEHDDGTGSTAWGSNLALDYQLNDWLLAVSPGVYIYRVESRVPGQEGQTAIGKFAILK